MSGAKINADRMKAIVGDVRTVLDDELSRNGRPGAEARRPAPQRLAEALVRLAKVNALELLAAIRSNPEYFSSRLFERP